MEQLALYRKWRSKDFEELLGQPHLTQTLKNAISSGKIAHAYLFCGPRGTGKTSAAKIFAKALNCEKGPTPTPCNQCPNCLGIAQGSVTDCIELDAASNRGIDEIRDLREKVKFAPTQLRTKVYIIDEVHMLTAEAFNALLKTLEEPPPQTVFILCTTEPHKLLPTVASRCQRFDLKRIGSKLVQSRLEEVCRGEKITIESGAFPLIVEAAEGSLRDALSVLDQLRTFCGGEITKEDALAFLGQTPKKMVLTFIEHIAEGDLKKLLMDVHDAVEQGADLTQLVRDLLGDFRRITLFKMTPNVLALEQEEAGLLETSSSRFQPEALYRILRILADLRHELRSSQHHRLSVEMTLMRLVKAQWEPSLEGLKRRIEELENIPPSVSSKNVPVPEVVKSAPETPREIQMSFESIQNHWPEWVEKLRVSRSSLFPLLQESKPVKLEGNRLTLAFVYPFHKNMLEQKREEAEKVLKEKFQVSLNLIGKVESVDHDSMLREATELFPGAVIVGEGG